MGFNYGSSNSQVDQTTVFWIFRNFDFQSGILNHDSLSICDGDVCGAREQDQVVLNVVYFQMLNFQF